MLLQHSKSPFFVLGQSISLFQRKLKVESALPPPHLPEWRSVEKLLSMVLLQTSILMVFLSQEKPLRTKMLWKHLEQSGLLLWRSGSSLLRQTFLLSDLKCLCNHLNHNHKDKSEFMSQTCGSMTDSATTDADSAVINAKQRLTRSALMVRSGMSVRNTESGRVITLETKSLLSQEQR